MNIASPASSGSPLSPHSPCAFATTTEARFADFKAQATPSSSVSSPVCGDSQMAWVNHSKRVRAALGPPTASESSSVAKRPARKKRKGVLHVSSAARQPTLEENIYVHLSHEGTPEKLPKASFALQLGPRGFSYREDATSTIQPHNVCDSRQKLAPRTRTFAGMFSQGHLPSLSSASFSVSDEERENEGSDFPSNSSQSDRFSPVHSSLLAVQSAVEENLYVHLSQENTPTKETKLAQFSPQPLSSLPCLLTCPRNDSGVFRRCMPQVDTGRFDSDSSFSSSTSPSSGDEESEGWDSSSFEGLSQSSKGLQFHGSDDLGTAEADSENDNASNKRLA